MARWTSPTPRAEAQSKGSRLSLGGGEKYLFQPSIRTSELLDGGACLLASRRSAAIYRIVREPSWHKFCQGAGTSALPLPEGQAHRHCPYVSPDCPFC